MLFLLVIQNPKLQIKLNRLLLEHRANLVLLLVEFVLICAVYLEAVISAGIYNTTHAVVIHRCYRSGRLFRRGFLARNQCHAVCQAFGIAGDSPSRASVALRTSRICSGEVHSVTARSTAVDWPHEVSSHCFGPAPPYSPVASPRGGRCAVDPMVAPEVRGCPRITGYPEVETDWTW